MTLQEILYDAVNSPFGIEVQTDNPINLRSQLYAEMRRAKENGCTDFENLSLHLNPTFPTTMLWVVKNETKTRTTI